MEHFLFFRLKNCLVSQKNRSGIQTLIMIAFNLSATHRIYRSLTTGNPEIRRIFALRSIDVKLETMRDYRISQSLAEF